MKEKQDKQKQRIVSTTSPMYQEIGDRKQYKSTIGAGDIYKQQVKFTSKNNGSLDSKLAASSFHYPNGSHQNGGIDINERLNNGHGDMLRIHIHNINVKSVVILPVNSCHNTTARHLV